MGPKRYKVSQYNNYQPQLSRMLTATTTVTTETVGKTVTESEKEEKYDAPLYRAFFIMAQVGGFYSFLKLVFGSLYSLFLDKLMSTEFINKLKIKRSKNEDHRRSMYYSRENLKNSRIRPLSPNDNNQSKRPCSCPCTKPHLKLLRRTIIVHPNS